MTSAPTLFDRTAVLRYRARVAANASLFLQQAAIDDVHDRLAMVNRTFTSSAVVTAFPDLWSQAMPQARCVPDEPDLDLRDQSHDLVIHAVSLHCANDPVGQLIQCRRSLKPDGLCLAILPGGRTLTELRSSLSQAEVDVTGGLSPRVAPMGEIRELAGLLQRAGFALPVADSIEIRARYRDAFHLMRDLRAMGESNALTGRLRRPTRRAVFETADKLYREHYPDPEGGVFASFELIALTGWAPAPDQPQPLRPGSAATRLAEALQTPEIKLRD